MISSRRHGVPVVVLVVVTLVFFSGLLQGHTYSDVSRFQRIAYPWGSPTAPLSDADMIHFDQAKSYYPWQVFMSRSFRNGDVPLWNPYAFAGTPFLAANANSALYPPRVALSLTVPGNRVHDVHVSTHMFLAGLTMYLLLAYFGASRAGAVLGAVAWMASSFMLAWLALDHFVVMAAFLPLAVLLADLSIRRRSWPATVALGLVLALLFLGGVVLLVQLVFVAVGTYAFALVAARVVRRARTDERADGAGELVGDLARLAVPWLLFLGLSAAVLLPTAELVGSSVRSPLAYRDLREFAVPPSELVRLFAPPNHYLTAPGRANAYHAALFGGTAVAFFAIVGLAARRRGAWFARVLGLFALLVALGTPLLVLPYVLLPGFDNMKPLGRVLFLFAFALAVLAAFGLDQVSTILRQRLGARRGVVAAGVLSIAAIGLTIGQLRAYASHVMHHQETAVSKAYPATPLVRRLQREGNVRFLPVGGILPGSTPLLYGLRNAFGYESIVPGRVQDFWLVVAGLPADRLSDPLYYAFEPAPPLRELRTDLLSRAGVTLVAAPPPSTDEEPADVDRTLLRQVYAGDDGRLFLVRNALGRAYFVARCVVAPDSRSALVRFQEPDFDARETVILERDDDIECSGTRRATAGSVRIVDEGINELTVEVDAPVAGFLVLNETWDAGWHASVGGRNVPVLPANSTFRAIPVEAGRQTVELRYRPRSYELGVWISLATLALTLVAFAALALRSRATRYAAGTTSSSDGA